MQRYLWMAHKAFDREHTRAGRPLATHHGGLLDDFPARSESHYTVF